MRDLSLLKEEKDKILAKFVDSIKNEDKEGFSQAFTELADNIQESVLKEAKELSAETDRSILASRGIRQLTAEETSYYQKVIEAMKSSAPKQALTDIDVVMPKTIIDEVFDDLTTNHPLLSKIDFRQTGGITEFLMSVAGYQKATWGELCDPIKKELEAGFKLVDTKLLKLSAWIPVCMAMLDLGPVYLDRYVRELLYEALANGLEDGIVNGDGDKTPIGMVRQVQDNVIRQGNKYPEKSAVKIKNFNVKTMGNLVSLLAVNPAGKPRMIRDLMLLVNPQDYYQLVLPATSFMKPDGTYATNVLPVDVSVIQTLALPRGKAVFGMASQYFAGAGMDKAGRIEYDDSVKFLEDQRVYKIKLYANGFPKDNNSFLVLDITALEEAALKVETVAAKTPSTEAGLSSLVIGDLALNPTFATGTTTYTATTTKASATVTAVPNDAMAKMKVTVKDKEINNGGEVTFETGANAVKVDVTAEDGKTKKTYTVTVTKS